MIRSATLFEVTRAAPTATFSVLLGFTTDARPSPPLATYPREQIFLTDVRRSAVTTFQLPANGNFGEVSLGRFSALYSGHPVFGEIFSLLSPAAGSLAIGVTFADSYADYHEVGGQIASMQRVAQHATAAASLVTREIHATCPLAPLGTGTPFGAGPGRWVAGPTPSPRRPLLFQEVPLDTALAALATRSSPSRSSVESLSLSPRPLRGQAATWSHRMPIGA